MTKAILSVIICFHLLCIFVLPNPDSILFRQIANVIAPYGSFIGINTTWRFFSPTPIIRIMEYKVFTPNEHDRLVEKTYRYPKAYKEELFGELYSRKLNNSMYMLSHLTYMKEHFSKVLCRWHPEAEVISVWAKGRNIPNLERSQLIEGDRTDLGEIQVSYMMDARCIDLRNESDKSNAEADANNGGDTVNHDDEVEDDGYQ